MSVEFVTMGGHMAELLDGNEEDGAGRTSSIIGAQVVLALEWNNGLGAASGYE